MLESTLPAVTPGARFPLLPVTSLGRAATNTAPEERSSEISAAEPYFIGSHSGASGAWVSGPEDLAPREYFWGYENMSTVKGLFMAGDASGANPHKFSSGSFTEGRLAGKSAVRFLVKSPGFALTAVLCLGLGIAANATVFGLFDALLWKPLPVTAPQALVRDNSTWPCE